MLAENIRKRAVAKKIALTSLADFSAVSRAQLFAVLGESASPTIDWLSKLAEALGVEVWELLIPPKNLTETKD